MGRECVGSAWSMELQTDIMVHMSADTKAGGYPQVEVMPGQAVDGSGQTKTVLAVVQAAEHPDLTNAALDPSPAPRVCGSDMNLLLTKTVAVASGGKRRSLAEEPRPQRG